MYLRYIYNLYKVLGCKNMAVHSVMLHIVAHTLASRGCFSAQRLQRVSNVTMDVFFAGLSCLCSPQKLSFAMRFHLGYGVHGVCPPYFTHAHTLMRKHTHMHTHTHAHMHTDTHAQTHTHAHTHSCTQCTQTHMRKHTHMHTHTHAHNAHRHTCTHTHISQ